MKQDVGNGAQNSEPRSRSESCNPNFPNSRLLHCQTLRFNPYYSLRWSSAEANLQDSDQMIVGPCGVDLGHYTRAKVSQSQRCA
ncbi:hypothetical protein TNCV_1010631 [Trichonephila clavipes]|nr:hypothetical protein TNCV_1010631 [Trichonephila clavipes]